MPSAFRNPLAQWGLLLLLVLAASLLGRPDIPIDETRYVSVAWEAWRSGDWLIMHMNGQAYHHKPPLLFWLIGLGWSAFGVNDWWPRAISALSALACVALTARIAKRLWPGQPQAPAIAGWLSLSSIFWLLFSSSVMFDTLLTAFTLLALLGVLDAHERGGWRGWLLCGVALGLGVLTKGPFVLLYVLPVAVLGPWWGGAEATGKAWWRGLAITCSLGAGIALLWVVPAALLGGEEFRNAILWRQVAGRVTGEMAHRQPFWFYLAAAPVLLFPLLLCRRAWSSALLQARRTADRGTRFLIGWTLPALVALSLAGGKQFHYILPLWPAVALLVAAGWSEVAEDQNRGLRLFPLVIAGLGVTLLAYPWWTGKQWFAALAGPAWQVGGGLLVLLAALLAAFSRRAPENQPRRLALAAIAVTGILMLSVVPAFRPAFDMSPMGEKLHQLQRQGTAIVHVSAYNDQYQFYGRLDHPLAQIGRNEIDAWFAEHPDGRAIVYLKNAADLAPLAAEFSQPYLAGAVALVDAQAAQRLNLK